MDVHAELTTAIDDFHSFISTPYVEANHDTLVYLHTISDKINHIGNLVNQLQNESPSHEFLLDIIYKVASWLRYIVPDVHYDENYLLISAMHSFLVYTLVVLAKNQIESYSSMALVLSELLLGLPPLPKSIRDRHPTQIQTNIDYKLSNNYFNFFEKTRDIYYAALFYLPEYSSEDFYSWLSQYDQLIKFQLDWLKFFDPIYLFRLKIIDAEKLLTEITSSSQRFINFADALSQLVALHVKPLDELFPEISGAYGSVNKFIDRIVANLQIMMHAFDAIIEDGELPANIRNSFGYKINTFAIKYLQYKSQKLKIRLLADKPLSTYSKLELRPITQQIIEYYEFQTNLFTYFHTVLGISDPLHSPFGSVYSNMLIDLLHTRALLMKLRLQIVPLPEFAQQQLMNLSIISYDVHLALIFNQIIESIVVKQSVPVIDFTLIDAKTELLIPRNLFSHSILKLWVQYYTIGAPIDPTPLQNYAATNSAANLYTQYIVQIFNDEIVPLPESLQARTELFLFDSNSWLIPNCSSTNKLLFCNFNLAKDRIIL